MTFSQSNIPGHLRRPRPALLITTASSPDLNTSYNNNTNNKSSPVKVVFRKSSLNLISCDPKRISTPDDFGKNDSPTENKYESHIRKMPPSPPHDEDLNLGDIVEVPGKMHGIVRFKGTVENKKGIFVGVELSEQFASRGKNCGDVDGVSYFSTTIPGAGIFLPVNRAIRRKSTPMLSESCLPLTPTTPVIGGATNQSQRSSFYSPMTPGISRYNQSIGNGRATSPQGRVLGRQSLPRLESPIIKQQSLKPITSSPNGKTPSKYGFANPTKFAHSVRGTQDSRDPSKKAIGNQRYLTKASLASRSTSALGHSSYTQSDCRATPVLTTRSSTHTSLESSLSGKVSVNMDENSWLRVQLEERDRQLKDQATSLTEMEKALLEVQSLLDSDTSNRVNRSSIDDKDIFQLRAMLREKNEKISMLTSEFDAHRADFRSTIDTLEMASSETERVYEQRINELMQEIIELSGQSIDVKNVAKHLRQLEGLVQELEEGLEEARRAEVEARGEVEFLRGEVERTKAELNREREKNSNNIAAGCNNYDIKALKELEQRDDEIRGLKKIIHSLSRDSVQNLIEDSFKTSTQLRLSSGEVLKSVEATRDSRSIERESGSLQRAVGVRSSLIKESPENFRRESLSALSASTATQEESTVRNSQGRVLSMNSLDSCVPLRYPNRALVTDIVPESDAYSSANESFCELCETPGHDILLCTKVFTSSSRPFSQNMQTDKNRLASHSGDKVAPPSPKKISRTFSELITTNSSEIKPVAGRESGIVDLDKWCAVCEREGHESIDCPSEETL